jgi:hypothetical protein
MKLQQLSGKKKSPKKPVVASKGGSSLHDDSSSDDDANIPKVLLRNSSHATSVKIVIPYNIKTSESLRSRSEAYSGGAVNENQASNNCQVVH